VTIIEFRRQPADLHAIVQRFVKGRRTTSIVMVEQTRKRPPVRGGMAFGRNLAVLGAFLFIVGAYTAIRGAMTLSWPRTDGTITSAELLRQHTPTTRRDGTSTEDSWNSFRVLYRYRVDGEDYVSGRVEPFDLGMQNSAGAARMRERHPEGSIARIAYDPQDPAVAYLEPGPGSFSMALTGIGAFILAAGFWVRRKASQGIGAMNVDGPTESINREIDRGESR
jgi:hypothetical protein